MVAINAQTRKEILLKLIKIIGEEKEEK